MSWSLPIYQSVALSEFLQQTLSRLSPASSCVGGVDGRSLWVEAVSPLDTATLPAMAQMCQQYLNLSDGEIAICNDVYTGGTDLSAITFVVGVGQGPGQKTDFILSSRLALEPRWVESGRLADEGVRIPPTPVGSLLKPNLDLIKMIGSQPQSPPRWESALQTLLAGLSSVHATLQHALSERNGVFHKACGKDFLADSARMFRKQVSHLALGESFGSVRLSGGEFIKLRMKVDEEKILFDFSGTDSSPTLNLTELMTFSTCFAAIQATLGHKVACNAGAFDAIVVSAPAKTLLNAKPPAGTWRGAHEGAPQLLEFLVAHLRKLNKIKLPPAVSAHPGFVELTFEDARGTFFFTLDHGLPSGDAHSGEARTPAWRLSAEELEQKFPVRFGEYGERRDSGEDGQTRGGNRRVLKIELLANAQARWNFSATNGERTLADLLPTVHIIDPADPSAPQALKGQAQMRAGQVLSLSSAAGRSSGEARVADDEAD